MRKALTRAQREALFTVFVRAHPGYVETFSQIDLSCVRKAYRKFRRTAQFNTFMGVVMVPYAGMWLGIEPDGYTHS